MVDGAEQAAAFRTAFDRGLPALLGAACLGVEEGLKVASPATFAMRASLLACLRVAQWTAELVLRAEQLGGGAPASPGVAPGPTEPTAPASDDARGGYLPLGGRRHHP